MAAGKILYYKRKRPPNGGLLCVRKPPAVNVECPCGWRAEHKRQAAETGDDRCGKQQNEGFLYIY